MAPNCLLNQMKTSIRMISFPPKYLHLHSMHFFSKYLLSNHFVHSYMLHPMGNYKTYVKLPALMCLNNQCGKTKHAHIIHFYSKKEYVWLCTRKCTKHTSWLIGSYGPCMSQCSFWKGLGKPCSRRSVFVQGRNWLAQCSEAEARSLLSLESS